MNKIIIYKSLLSHDLCGDILDFCKQKIVNITMITASNKFPPRKQIRDLPTDIISDIEKSLRTTLYNYYTSFEIKNNYRVYYSDFGTIKPHYDVPMCGDDTHTCLIYLTDDFEGGVLTIKKPYRDNLYEDNLHEDNLYEDNLYEDITFKPMKTYGVIFPKEYIHYTDELINGNKYILLVDLKIV